MHRWETVGGSSGAANKAFLGQMVKYSGSGEGGYRGGGVVKECGWMVNALNWSAAGFYF